MCWKIWCWKFTCTTTWIYGSQHLRIGRTEKEKGKVLPSTPFYHAHVINIRDLFWYKQFPVTDHHEQIIMFVFSTHSCHDCNPTLSADSNNMSSHFTCLQVYVSFCQILSVSPGVVNRVMKYDNWSMISVYLTILIKSVTLFLRCRWYETEECGC